MSQTFLFFFTTLASTESFAILAILITLYLLLKYGRYSAGIFFGSYLGLALSVVILKNLFAVARPADALITLTSYAFPSGHAAGVMFLGVTGAYLSRTYSKPVRYTLYIVLAALVLAIGWSRLYLHVHTPLQVLGGYAVGALWALVWVRYIAKHTVPMK
ncbi:phosphatase PAP2 family protein [Candidatus Parcubacteria bacterium]|uniref:Phosphatidic acid phosphatase type 2/haloperoxidase domain-containing protein n=1 Tax=Candidatus Kaiserbacteria bacterium CG10_big_fil_rev_8_21_14_0_10_47_16 TaxID=1974608 RepID=A0A2H0UEI4_9BACT|nr:phosphatase PAP2 family protein [Candidatus Parcubacteria bacterium]PIR84812.1 MAG: hypothetical protein COU16_01345 [Candidatus Kaiserbacteria bacterium CG10_big_fil_rev_8_21_14_0_10_47_16]